MESDSSAKAGEVAPPPPDGSPLPPSQSDGTATSAASFGGSLTRGSVWVVGGYVGSQAIRLGGNLVLWRLLYPGAFGIMAIINVFLQGLQMFSDVGIGPSIIQHKRGDDPAYLNTAWTIQAIRGIALFLVAALGAPIVAKFYGEPSLASLIPVVGLGAAVAGMNSTNLFTAVRRIALGRLTLIDLCSQLVGLVVMLLGAYLYRTVWGLVLGGLVGNIVRLVLGHLALPGIRNRPAWDPASARTLLKFGRWIFLSTLLTFAVGQSDRLIFGKLIPIELLGVYSIATIWSGLPIAILERVFSSVLFPILSRLHDEGADFQTAFREARTPALMLGGWMIACLIGGAPALIHFLYDTRATEAGWIVQLLSAGTWFLALETTNGTALLAQGKAKWLAAGSAAKLVGMAVSIPVGFAIGGFWGAVAGFSGSEVLRYLVSAVGGMTIHLRGVRQDLELTAMVAVTSVLGVFAGTWARRMVTPHVPAHFRWQALSEGAVILVVISVVWALLFWLRRGPRKVTRPPQGKTPAPLSV